MRKAQQLPAATCVAGVRRVLIAVLLALCAGKAAAQTNRGGIAGTVFDPQGAVVPGATVVITSLGTNQERRATTSGSGSYSVVSLEPVAYKVAVTAPGFRAATVEHVKVDTATVARVDVKLQAGGVVEETTVVAEAPLLDAQSGTPGQTITERQITEMPLNNRSVLDLAMTVGNVSGLAGTEDPELNVGSADIPTPGFNMFVTAGARAPPRSWPTAPATRGWASPARWSPSRPTPCRSSRCRPRTSPPNMGRRAAASST